MVIPGLGVAPLEDSGTDLEDELPTQDGLPSTGASNPVLGHMPQGVDLELARALLELGVLPAMVTPIVDLVVGTSATLALYPVPLIPVLSVVGSAPVLVASPIRQVGDPSSGSFHVVPGIASWLRVWYEPIPYQISPSLLSEDVARPPSGLAPMDQYLPRRASLGGVRWWVPRPGSRLLLWPNRVCRTCLGRAPLTFIGIIRRLVPLHGCWTVSGAVNTA